MSYDLKTLRMEYVYYTNMLDRLQFSLYVFDLTKDRRIKLLHEALVVENHLEHLEHEITYTEESERFWAITNE